MQTAIVLSQGTELTTGQTLDSNAHWICQQLWNRGYHVEYVQILPDSPKQLIRAFQESVQRASLIVSTGGLGPTEDDHTLYCLSRAFQMNLEFVPAVWTHIEQFFQRRGRTPSEQNRKMSYLPVGSTVLNNEIGSAVGVLIQKPNWSLYCFPGVPTEMKRMFVDNIPTLSAKSSLIKIATLGIGESAISDRIRGQIPQEVQIGYQASRKGNIIKLQVPEQVDPAPLIQAITTELQPYVFGVHQTDLATIIGQLLNEHQQKLAIAESCTAGKIASWVASISGSSAYLQAGFVVYSNAAKEEYCDVPPEMIRQYGAVSQQVATALSVGVRQRNQTDWGIAVTGIAGPSGGTPTKPVGTVYISCSGPQQCVVEHFQFSGTRNQITDSASAHALFMLYKQLRSMT